MDQVVALGHAGAGMRGATPAAASAQHREVARDFEAAILAELLMAAGAAQTGGEFGGGIGEDQFASFLVHEQAQRIADRGGIGLAEMALRALMRDDPGAGDEA